MRKRDKDTGFVVVDERGINTYGEDDIKAAVLEIIKRCGLMNQDDPELLDGSIADQVIDYLKEIKDAT